MRRLTVFISSTVKDIGPTRVDLRSWLHQKQMDVRMSEAPDFPVDDGLTSHDACLSAIEGCHLAIILIGERHGGGYAGTTKSITQREYEEAQRLRIPTIVLVRREVNAQLEMWAKSGRGKPPFTDAERIAAFVDAVRKGHTDNWFHAEWDGSVREACRIIQSRMNTLFVRYRDPHQSLVKKAKRLPDYAAGRLKVDETVAVLATMPISARDKLQSLFDVVAEQRWALLSYGSDDRWNFAVYAPAPRGRTLHVLARRAHSAIAITNRTWKVGEGHVATLSSLGLYVSCLM